MFHVYRHTRNIGHVLLLNIELLFSILLKGTPRLKIIDGGDCGLLKCSPLRGDIKTPSLSPLTFHKSSHNYLKGSVTQLVTFADVSQNLICPLPIHYIVIRYPQQMVQMAFCDLLHTFQKHITNVSQHIFVILLWGILTSPLIRLPIGTGISGLIIKVAF